jgi:hypothetical protein
MAKVRLPLQDVPVVDPRSGLMSIDWYDALKKIETLGLLDMALVPALTVSQLPAAGNRSAVSFVTDATATTFGTIVAGGGANKVPVYDDGTNWRIG